MNRSIGNTLFHLNKYKNIFLLFFLILIQTLSYAETVCVGNTYSLSGPGNPALVNPWVSSDVAIASVNNSGVVTGVAAGTCVITYTDDVGAQTNFNFSVIQYVPASITLTSAPGTNNQTLIFNNFSGGYYISDPIITVTYAVSPGATAALQNPASLPLGITASFSNGVFTISGAAQLLTNPYPNGVSFSYTIVVTSVSPCGNGAGTSTSTASGAFAAPCSEGPFLDAPTPAEMHQTICLGSPIVTLNVWTLNPSMISFSSSVPGLSATSSTTISGTPTQPGVYPFSVYVNFNCMADYSMSGEITVLAVPSISASGPTTICQGETVTLNSSVSSGITWSPGGLHTPSITTGTAGNYTAYTSLNGRTCTSNTIGVTIKPLPPVPTISSSTPTTFCDGSSVLLTSSAASGNTWSSGQTTQSIAATASGNYTVTANLNGCTATSLPKTVTVHPIPPAPGITTSGPLTFCAGDSVVLTSSSISGNSWSTGEGSEEISVTNSGDFSLTTTLNGCTSPVSEIIQVNVTPLPQVPVISSGGPLTFCAGDSVVLTSSAASGNVWSQNSETTQSITVNSAGNYGVAVTENGCTSSSQNIQVNVTPIPPVPVISASGPLTFCAGDSVVLTSSSISGNSWSTGEGSEEISVTNSGDFSLAITLNGCTSPVSEIIQVNVTPLPQVPVISSDGPLTFCEGNSVVLTSSAASGNVWSQNSETTQSITVNSTGDYGVAVTENGCTSSSQNIQVNVTPIPPVPVISASGPLTFCEGDSVLLTSSSVNNNTWSQNSETTQTIVVYSSGNYFVSVSENGCTSISQALHINATPLPPVPVISASGPLTFCDGDSVILTSSATTGNIWSQNNEPTQSITVHSSGDYLVTINEAGCSSTSTIVPVIVNPNPIVSLESFNAICNTNPPFLLSQGMPESGIYSVNGTEVSIFDPANAQIGINEITYSYQNEFECSDEAVSFIEVYDCLAIDVQTIYSIDLFPNPGNGIITIVTDPELIGTSVQLIDALGRLINTYSIQSTEMQLDLSNHGFGSYLLIFSNETFTQVKRLELVFH